MKKKLQATNIEIEHVVLSDTDKAILHSLGPVAEGIAKAFGSNCEVVIHSLSDISHSVVKIVNGHVTGRSVGAPITDLAADVLKKADTLETDTIGCYYTTLDDGTPLKSVTTVIRNNIGKIIGMMCINIDLSVPLVNFVRGFLPSSEVTAVETEEHFPSDLDELVARTLDTAIARQGKIKKISATQKNKMIVAEFYNKGLFKITGVIDIVARNLGISRYTVYNYIREIKGESVK
jgi:predicted transcriptional regulator YheO